MAPWGRGVGQTDAERRLICPCRSANGTSTCSPAARWGPGEPMDPCGQHRWPSMSVFSELKRRNVFRVAAAYLVAGWLLIEVSATLEETLRLPEWADTLLAFFLILGFPIALFFSWAYEITPDGIKREKDIEVDDASRAQTAHRLNWVVIVLLVLAVSLFVVDRVVLEDGSEDPATPALVQEAPQLESGQSDEETAASDLSIAVLPFVNMSSDPEQDYFSDGLSEELLNLLAKLPELRVTSRSSAFAYKGKEINVPEVAAALGVAHILEGSVRKSGNRVRITAQLIDARDDVHLWSEAYDRDLDDIFAIQDEISAAVVDELKITLLGEAPHATVIDTRSWELTQQARWYYNRRAEGDWQTAFELFEQAIALDSKNASAWVGIAPLYAYVFEPPRQEEMLAALDRALELEPNNALAHIRKAQYMDFKGNIEASRAEAALALRFGLTIRLC